MLQSLVSSLDVFIIGTFWRSAIIALLLFNFMYVIYFALLVYARGTKHGHNFFSLGIQVKDVSYAPRTGAVKFTVYMGSSIDASDQSVIGTYTGFWLEEKCKLLETCNIENGRQVEFIWRKIVEEKVGQSILLAQEHLTKDAA